MSATLTALLNAALARGLIDPAAMQVWAVARLLQPPVAPAATKVAPWVEQQGLGSYHPPRVPYPLAPHAPALLWGEAAAFDLPALASLLLERYPPHHPLTLVLEPDECIVPLALAELATTVLPPAPALALIVPALAIEDDRRGLDRLRWVITRLLGPDGCPWDVRQTHQSLRNALLEEVYEALEALDAGDMALLREELGDVLLQVAVHSEMARQAGHFSLEEVVQHIADKLVFRHPHVFGTTDVADAGQVLRNWDSLKAQELAAKGKTRASALDGVPAALPALAAAQALARKAIRAGFTWETIDQVWAKVAEEVAELREASDPTAQMAETGDLLFAIATLAHWLHIDAETALREANARYKRRFLVVEQMAAESGRALRDCTLAEMMAWWAAAKARCDGQ
ncbi:nucleoside triphosphate pyrophosphohydrolase [Chloroflexus islandicus]|uniref:Nucleoside triphosphate pyrophosphohydrolase n=1 Tax=Chloroflexus islandicus TaxID=1707952 RepID=A0A178MJU4_9CHLR|nr:nucleoside triphosphate pyrophosphohydrolase [Chloroflexus islandicus]OAN48274.1 nucleoside triphosphate pyrophosphohydrolase [Chloroflexus islandicus]